MAIRDRYFPVTVDGEGDAHRLDSKIGGTLFLEQLIMGERSKMTR